MSGTSADLLAEATWLNRVGTALHESAHAVTYLAGGHEFEHLVVLDNPHEGTSGYVLPASGPQLEGLELARIAMAGPVADGIIAAGSADPVEWIMGRVIARHAFNRDLMMQAGGPFGPEDDFDLAGDFAREALPWSMAAVCLNWSQVVDVAQLALVSNEPVKFTAVTSLVGASVDSASDEFARMEQRCLSAIESGG